MDGRTGTTVGEEQSEREQEQEQGCPNQTHSRVPTNQFSRPTPHPEASLPSDVPLSPRFALASGWGPPAPGSPWRCASFLARFLRGWVGFLFGVLVRGWDSSAAPPTGHSYLIVFFWKLFQRIFLLIVTHLDFTPKNEASCAVGKVALVKEEPVGTTTGR